MMFLVMATQPILSEIVARYPQNTVNMVWIIGKFRVRRDDGIVLDQQRRTMNAIVHRLACFSRTHPREMKLVEPRALKPSAVGAGNVGLKVAKILIHQRLQKIALAA